MKSKTPYKKTKRRVGRGIGSTVGKTCGRGTKGLYSRSGAKRRLSQEGGQNTFIRRLPKRGFVHPQKKIFEVINVSLLGGLNKTEVTPKDLMELGVIKRIKDGVKVLAKGTIDKAVTIHAHAFSEAAKEKIEKAGGKVVIIQEAS
ncbi:50S ribosomal protein L15 [Candidatus Omnitrophota bacterium]